MANSDGQVRIYIDTNAKEAAKALDDVDKSFKKNANTVKSVSTVYNSYEKAIQENVASLREMALGGGKNSTEFQRLAQQTRDYKKALDEANQAVNNAVGGMDKQQNGMNKLISACKNLVAAYISIQGAVKAFHFALESVEAYRTQERAIIGLNTALKNAGVYTGEYANHLQKLAAEIQNYSNYGDEAILKAQSVAQAFMGAIPITDELTKAVVDFAAAMDMDLEQAFTLVGKSIGSSTNALGRYGVELQKGMTDSQKMAAITKQLGDRYKGQAQQMANASTQLKNSIGDLKEAIGRGLNPVLEASQRKMIAWTKSATDAINKMSILRAEVKSLSLDELNERLKANIDRVGEIESHYNPKANWQTIAANEARRNKLLEDRKQILEQIKKLQAPAQAKPIKFKEDDFGASQPLVSAQSSSVSSANVKKIKDDYDRLQESVAKAKREIENAAIAHGTSSNEVKQAFTSYRQLNQQLQEIGSLFEPEKIKIEEQKGAYQQLQDKVSSLTQSLRDLAAENKVGTTEWVNQKTALTEAQAELDQINKSLKDNGINVEEVSKSISSSLSSGLVTALRTGGNAFDAFSNLAVSALQKVLDKLIEMAIITPILDSFTGGMGGTIFGGLGKLFGSADGNVFKNGNVIPFARGGIVKQPTIFPMANGGTGLMGEAGAEAVMPLRRMSNGRLGVEADAKNATVINIYNQSQSQIETRKRDDGSMDIIVKRVNEALMNERTSSGFRAAYQREDRKGLQAV